MLAETSVFTGSRCRSPAVVVPGPWWTVSAMGLPTSSEMWIRIDRKGDTPGRHAEAAGGSGPGDGRLAARSTTRLQAPDRGRGGGPRRRNQIGTRGHDAPGPDALHATPGA